MQTWTIESRPATPGEGDLAPDLRLTAPLPSAVRAEAARRLPLLHQGRRPSDLLFSLEPPMSDEATLFLANLTAFVFQGALWISDGETLERRRLLGGSPYGSWPLPDPAALFPRLRARALRPAGLTPFAALDERRLLFAGAGWDADHQRREVLLAFDPSRDSPWLPLRPASGSEFVSTGRGSVRRTDDPDRFVFTQIVDGGAAAHIDDFIDVASSLELDLRQGLASPAEAGLAGPACPPLAPTHRRGAFGGPESSVTWTSAITPAAAPPSAPPLSRPGLLARVRGALGPSGPPPSFTTFLGTLYTADWTKMDVRPLRLDLQAPPSTNLEAPFLAAARAGPDVLCLDLFAGTHATLRLWRVPGLG